MQFERPVCPANGILIRCLKELYENAKNAEKNQHVVRNYLKAAGSVARYPLSLSSGKACREAGLIHIGPATASQIDVWLKKNGLAGGLLQRSLSAPSTTGQHSWRTTTTAHSIPQTTTFAPHRTASVGGNMKRSRSIATTTLPKRQKSSKAYVPKRRSGTWSILLALYHPEDDPNATTSATKKDMVELARPLCDASFERIDNSYYTAWSSMATLRDKDLVVKPSRGLFRLTKKGWDMAKELSSQQEVVPEEIIPESTRSLWSSPPRTNLYSGLPLQRVVSLGMRTEEPLLNIVERHEEPLTCSLSAGRKIQPVGRRMPSMVEHEVVLLVDNREIRGRNRAGLHEHLKATLRQHEVKWEERQLKVGDFVWIMRPVGGGREYMLDWIVERKKVDDLGSSIVGTRYIEQKYRMKKSGLSRLVYLIEGSVQEWAENPQGSLTTEHIYGAIMHTLAVNGFIVQHTASFHDTMMYLVHLHHHLYEEHKYEDPTSRTLFEEHQIRTDPTAGLTVRQLFIQQLMLLSGVSAVMADAITALYPTPQALVRAYERHANGKDMLYKEVTYLSADGKRRRKVGAGVSHRVYELFMTEHYRE